MQVAETFTERGYLAIGQLFDPPLIDSVRDEVMRQFGAFERGQLPAHLKVGHRRIQVPVALSGPLLDPMISANPLLLRLVEQILGADSLIDNLVCVVARPGAREQSLHRDHPHLFPEAKCGNCESHAFAITVVIPLVDFTPETGTTRVYPGTHRIATEPDETALRNIEAELPYVARGGCYFMDYRLWHQGTANRSPIPRPALYIIYARGWFTDLLNFRFHERMLVSEDSVMRMPPGQRRLFRRMAVKGALNLTEAELCAGVRSA